MNGPSRPLKGLGPYNVWDVAVGLLAIGIAVLVWGLLTTTIVGTFDGLPVIAGVILLVAGAIVLRWDLAHRA